MESATERKQELINSLSSKSASGKLSESAANTLRNIIMGDYKGTPRLLNPLPESNRVVEVLLKLKKDVDSLMTNDEEKARKKDFITSMLSIIENRAFPEQTPRHYHTDYDALATLPSELFSDIETLYNFLLRKSYKEITNYILNENSSFRLDEPSYNSKAVLDGEVLITPEQFKNTSGVEIKELDRLVDEAQNQIKRDERWKNVRIILHTGKKPTEFDNVFPGRDDIGKAYKDVIDTSIIPGAIYDNGIIIYMIPIDIQVAEGTGTELGKISLV